MVNASPLLDAAVVVPADHVQITPQHMAIVRSILRQNLPNTPVFAFGSRVVGIPRTYSDLDLAVLSEQSLSIKMLRRLHDAFEDSDLPICVDIVDWLRADPDFKKAVSAQGMAAL